MIHTNICGPFDVPSWGGEKYFIFFIDGFSCYCYQYLAASILDVFCQWVERQLDRKVKVVKSDRGVNSLESMMKVVNVQIH